MSSRLARHVLWLVVPLSVAGCWAGADNADHAACRHEWRQTFNAIFENSLTSSDVRWMQACMERRGYKRLYDGRRCQRLEASFNEPDCYARSSSQASPS